MYSSRIFVLTMFINATLCEESFGKFSLNVTKFDKCKGPKRKDCATWTARIENGKNLCFNLTALENIAHLKGKIMVSANGKSLVRLQLNKVCDHIFLKPLFKTILNITDDCVISKGDYIFKVDAEEMLQKYYGGNFFFGNVSFKSVFNNDECNFTCSNLVLVLYPKKS